MFFRDPELHLPLSKDCVKNGGLLKCAAYSPIKKATLKEVPLETRHTPHPLDDRLFASISSFARLIASAIF